MTDRIELDFTPAFWVMAIFIGIITFGLGTLLLVFVAARRWPKSADRDGLTLRNGVRYRWEDLNHVVAVRVNGAMGVRVAGRADLHFGTEVVHVVPVSIAPTDALFALIQDVTGRLAASG